MLFNISHDALLGDSEVQRCKPKTIYRLDLFPTAVIPINEQNTGLIKASPELKWRSVVSAGKDVSDRWYNEAKQYDFDQPGFTAATGGTNRGAVPQWQVEVTIQHNVRIVLNKTNHVVERSYSLLHWEVLHHWTIRNAELCHFVILLRRQVVSQRWCGRAPRHSGSGRPERPTASGSWWPDTSLPGT